MEKLAMKTQARRLPLLAAALLLGLLPLLAAPARAEGGRALLIGIQDYASEPLAGPVNDVALMKRLLTERLGFAEANITTLLDGAATHTGIRDAFAALAKAAEPDDFVYIHYSGHGSRRGAHSTWVPFGARSGRSGGADDLDDHDILDSEVGAWLQGIYAKTPNVLLVSDSCHSGHFTRGRNLGVRAVARDPRPHPLEAPEGAEYRPGNFSGAKVTAAGLNELSYEYAPDESAKHGRFTWFWAESIAGAQPGETWKDIFNRSYHKTVFSDAGQHPLFSGKLPLRVLGGEAVSVFSGVVVRAVEPLEDGASRVTLNVGKLEGVTVGSRYAGADGASLEITAVRAFESEGRGQGGFAKGDLVRETQHMFRGEPLRPALRGAPEHVEACGRDLRETPGFAVAEREEEADCVLVLEAVGDRLHVRLLSRGEQELAGPFAVARGENGPDFSTVAEALKRLRRVRDLKSLASSHPGGDGKMPVEMRITRWTPAEQPGDFTEIKEFNPDGKGKRPFGKLGEFGVAELDLQRLKVGDTLTFALKNTDGEGMNDWFCYLWDITPGGDVDLLFPDGNNHAQGRIAYNAEAEVWPSYIVVEAQEETVKLLVTARRLEHYEQLAQEGYAALARRGASANPLQELLADAFDGRPAATRGGANDTWFTEQFTFFGE